MRCPDCNKFVGQEMGEPEDDGFEVSKDGENATVAGSCTLGIECAECGTPLKSACFECSEDFELPKEHRADEGHELEVEVELEGTEDYGKGKRAPHFYGVSATIKVTCECGWTHELSWGDSMQASSFDEC